MSKTSKVYEFNTEKFNSKFLSIIKDAGNEEGKWQKTWQLTFEDQYKASGLDIELKDNKLNRYKGVNNMLMSMVSEMNGYKSKFWSTYKGWIGMGYAPKDASNCGIIRPIFGVNKETGKEYIVKWITVPGFNGDQVQPVHKAIPKWNDHDYAIFNDEPKANAVDMNKDCEELISKFMKKQKAKLKHQGSHAYYQLSTDTIVMPDEWKFFGIDGESDATQEYLSVIFHEAGHLTGHPSRLNRDMDSYHKCKESRAKEELIAEMCSIMVCTELNVIAKAQPNHLKYISSWDRAIKDDSQYLIKCIAQASKAATWILDNKTPKVVVN